MGGGVYSIPVFSLAVALTLAAGLAAPVGARAQEAAGDTLRLTVAEAVQRALVANEETRIARTNVDRTEGQVREAYARVMPTIDGSYR